MRLRKRLRNLNTNQRRRILGMGFRLPMSNARVKRILQRPDEIESVREGLRAKRDSRIFSTIRTSTPRSHEKTLVGRVQKLARTVGRFFSRKTG